MALLVHPACNCLCLSLPSSISAVSVAQLQALAYSTSQACSCHCCSIIKQQSCPLRPAAAVTAEKEVIRRKAAVGMASTQDLQHLMARLGP